MLHSPQTSEEFYRFPVRSRCVLYGGQKDQRANLVRIPAGATGITRLLSTRLDDGSQFYLVRFKVGSRVLWARTAPGTLELGGSSERASGTP